MDSIKRTKEREEKNRTELEKLENILSKSNEDSAIKAAYSLLLDKAPDLINLKYKSAEEGFNDSDYIES